MATKIDLKKCNGCGECVDVCPASTTVYTIINKKAVIKHPEQCICCNTCIQSCPEDAIKEA